MDIVFNSWMPEGIDLTECIVSLGADALVFVRNSERNNGATGVPDVSYNVSNNYFKVASFKQPSYSEINGYYRNLICGLTRFEFATQQEFESYVSHKNWFEKYRCLWIPEGNEDSATLEYCIRKDELYTKLNSPPSIVDSDKYPWEGDLEFLLSHRDEFRKHYFENQLID